MVIAITAIFFGLSLGSVKLPFSTIFLVIFHKLFRIPLHHVSQTSVSIIWLIRLPRVILAFLIGLSLSVSGVAFQSLLRNPLADPYTLGVSSGASLGAVLVIYSGISLPFLSAFTLPIVSILFAFLTLLGVLIFSNVMNKGLSIEILILTGIIFNSFLSAFLSLLIAFSNSALREMISWLLGSVSMRGWQYVWLLLPFVILGLLLLVFNRVELNAFALGEESAHNLGVSVTRSKLLILLATSLLTGAAVAVSGTIGFVGLVIPHITRLIWGANHRDLIGLSGLLGGAFLVLADLVSRTIIAPTELPIGIMTALIGAPVFAMILFNQRKSK